MVGIIEEIDSSSLWVSWGLYPKDIAYVRTGKWKKGALRVYAIRLEERLRNDEANPFENPSPQRFFVNILFFLGNFSSSDGAWLQATFALTVSSWEWMITNMFCNYGRNRDSDSAFQIKWTCTP